VAGPVLEERVALSPLGYGAISLSQPLLLDLTSEIIVRAEVRSVNLLKGTYGKVIEYLDLRERGEAYLKARSEGHEKKRERKGRMNPLLWGSAGKQE